MEGEIIILNVMQHYKRSAGAEKKLPALRRLRLPSLRRRVSGLWHHTHSLLPAAAREQCDARLCLENLLWCRCHCLFESQKHRRPMERCYCLSPCQTAGGIFFFFFWYVLGGRSGMFLIIFSPLQKEDMCCFSFVPLL